jgi:cell division protein FtsW
VSERRSTPLNATYVLLLATVVVLNVVGLVMVLSASSVLSLTSYGSAWYFFERQLIWAVLGAVGFAVAARLDYRAWRRLVGPLLFGSLALLVLVLVPHVGSTAGGAQRWLGVGSWRFQPTEIAKLALVLYAADLLTRREQELADWRRVLRPVLLVFGALGGLVYLQPDLDSALLLGMIAGAVLLTGGVRLRHLGMVGGIGVTAAAVLAVSEPYRRARVLTFLHPTADASNTGYQIVQSLIALGSGGYMGDGLGAGRSKWLFLPNAHTDFIFSVIGEELGLLGTLAVLGLFLAFAALGIRTAQRAPDRFGMLLAAGVTVWVVAQAAINIGGVVGLLPVSGIPLPFVSFGGSSLVFAMLGAGILASVARAVAGPSPSREEPRAHGRTTSSRRRPVASGRR